MLIFYLKEKLKKEFENERLLQRNRGRDQAEKIKARLANIDAARDLAELENLPGNHHQLHADKSGLWACNLNANYRLIYEPWPSPPATLPGGGLDKQSITEVRIHGVLDYHERKNKKPQ
jgi:toxin HigB-1